MREQFLPDGGIALAAGTIRLPRYLYITDNTVDGQILKEHLPGRTMVHVPIFGHMFTFLVAMKPEALIDHIEKHTILTLTNFRPGPPQTALITGEPFRDVLCDPVMPGQLN